MLCARPMLSKHCSCLLHADWTTGTATHHTMPLAGNCGAKFGKAPL